MIENISPSIERDALSEVLESLCRLCRAEMPHRVPANEIRERQM